MSLESVLSQVQSSSAHLVRFLYCDTSSIVRGKATHVEGLKDRLKTGIGLVKGMMAMNLLDQPQGDTGLGAVGEVRLVPDLETFTILPYSPHSALLLCDMIELDHSPWELCPRTVLKKQISKASEMGLRIEAAFEPEFMLGSVADGVFKPIDESLCFSTEGMSRGDGFIHKFVSALERQGLQVEQYYPELGHGQHELSIRHASALKAADQQILYRETLRGVAAESGLTASLAPKPFADQAGNGCHLHLSVWDTKTNKNKFWADDGFSEFGRQFIAGILNHLQALVAVTAPSVNSYRRLKPQSWSSAFTCWGFENREAAVRVPTVYWGQEEASSNIELKCVDSSCNPYLALACVIACGLDGIEKKLSAPKPVSVDPATLSKKELSSNQIERLPSSLKESLACLEKDELLQQTMGEKFHSTFIIVKRSEAAAFAKESVEYELKHHRTKF